MNAAWKKFVFSIVLTASLVALLSRPGTAIEPLLSPPPLQLAQIPVRVYDAWESVYDILPDLPLENQYVNQETGNVASNSTLVDRLIRYHIFVKGRAPNQRLDWKFTLADYLGANEPLLVYQYPGHDMFTVNPIDGDVAVIQQLDRQERDRLIAALVSVFTPATTATPAPTTPTPTTPTPTTSTPTDPVHVGPGAADLLLR